MIAKIASKYLVIHDHQTAIAHLLMKERQIASNFFSERERQVTSNYVVMLVMFAHLAIEERQIASNFFSKRECQVTTATPYVCLTKQIIQKGVLHANVRQKLLICYPFKSFLR
jgi:hypothetical protein